MITANSKKLRYWDFFKGRLRLETSLHIGTSAITVETDAALLRDSCGRFYIPGTSIAGALRAGAEALFAEDALIKAIFGYPEENKQEEGENSDKDKGQKSKLFVEDTICPDDFLPTVRDGVGIDRKYGTAYPGAKYDLEITPCDLELDLIIRLETRERDNVEKMRGLVFELMEEFRKGNIRLGAQKSRGLGRCCFDYEWRTLDFGDSSQLRTWLLTQETLDKIDALPQLKCELASVEKKKNVEEIALTLEMEIASSPFLIKHGWEGDDVDAVFTHMCKKNGESQDYIPGSSVKGVFRSRAEKILRTLEDKSDVCDILDGKKNCAALIKEKKEEAEKNRKKDFTDEELAKLVRGISCPICRLFGNGYWASRILFSDAFFEGTPEKKHHDHVAIDRFTGGAAEGKLFNAKPVVQGKTRFQILLRNPADFDKALLLFLLRDLKEGLLPLRFGYGKTKGYGLLNLVFVEINGARHEAGEIDFSTLLNPMPDFKEWWKGGRDAGK